MRYARIYPWRRTRRSRAPSNGPDAYFVAQFSAGYTTNMFGFDLRQGQDIAQRSQHVRFVPSADVRRDSVSRSIRARFSAHRHRPRRRPAAQGRAMSNRCTFSPSAIRGFDGSKRSRTSRFLTSERATTKASFRLLACRSATLKKALPKWVHLALSRQPNDGWSASAAVITSVSGFARRGIKTPK